MFFYFIGTRLKGLFRLLLIFKNSLFIFFSSNTNNLLKREYNIFLVYQFICKHNFSKFNSAHCFYNNVTIFGYVVFSWIKVIYFTRFFKADTNNLNQSFITSIFEVLIVPSLKLDEHFASNSVLPARSHLKYGEVFPAKNTLLFVEDFHRP